MANIKMDIYKIIKIEKYSEKIKKRKILKNYHFLFKM